MSVDSRLGTMDDFKTLITEVHKRGMKLLVDFIPNHTSLNHTWFMESSTNRSATNPYWNYYIWGDCTENHPPNNWVSVYGNSSWTWIAQRRQYYFHNFRSNQPELNLRSSSVLANLKSILEFWLSLGVDGFRVRDASFLLEDGDLRSEPVTCQDLSDYECLDHVYTRNQAENVIMVTRWRQLLDKYNNKNYRILAVESDDSRNQTIAYYGDQYLNGAELPINRELSQVKEIGCSGDCVREKVTGWLEMMPSGATGNWQTANSEYGRLAFHSNNTLLPAMTLLKMTLPGVTFVYYGEEIGMSNGNVTSPGLDPVSWIDLTKSRDGFRTAMQWSDAPNAGFSNATNIPISINDDYITTNVKAENGSSGSQLSMFRHLVKLRTEDNSFKVGSLTFISTPSDIISYIREFNGKDRYLTAINFGKTDMTVNLQDGNSIVPESAQVAVVTPGSSHSTGSSIAMNSVKLVPHEGVLFKWPYSR